MTLKETLINRLESLSQADKLSSDSPIQYEITLPQRADWPGLRVSLTDCDRYSAMLYALEIGDLTAPGRDVPLRAHLQAQAEALIARLNYLVEPLSLLETDPSAGIAQLRSQPQNINTPADADAERNYWEVLIYAKPTQKITLARYRWQASQPDREQIAYPVIFSNLGRMVEDMAGCLQDQEKTVGQ